jgi:hypothetical protein
MAIDNPVYADFVAQGLANSDVGNPNPALDWVTHGVPAMLDNAISSTWNGVDYTIFKAGQLVQSAADAITGNDNPLPKFIAPDLNQITDEDVHRFIEGGDMSDGAARFADAHQQGVELGGFLLGSIIPGGMSVKLLREYQAGRAVSQGAASATGILSNTAERYWLQRGASLISAGESATKARWLASAAGAAQAGLEGLAFEMGSYAALNQHPIYDSINDWEDFASHLASTGMIFGAAGGLLKYAGWASTKFLDEAGNITTIGKVRDAAGEKLTQASYVEQKAGNLAGAPVAKGVNITTGDVIADLARSQPPQALLPTGDAVLDTKLAITTANRDQALDTLTNKLYADLAGDDALTVKAAMEKLGPQATARLLTGAEKITRASETTIPTSKTFFLDLANGATANKAVLLAGDLGKVAWKDSAMTVDGKVWDLTKEINGVGLLNGDVSKVNAAYWAAAKAAEEAQLAGQSAAKAVTADALPALEADLRTFGEIAVTDNNGTVLRYSGQNAVDALRQLKQSAMQEMVKLKIPMEEMAARLNVKQDFFTNPNAPESSFINAIDPTQRRWMAIKYQTANAPSVWALRGAAVLDDKIAAARQQQQIVATSVLGRQLPDFAVSELNALEHRFAGWFSSSNAAYNSVLEKAQAAGAIRQAVIEDMAVQRAASMVNAEQTLRNFGEKSKVAVALAAIANRVRGTGLKYKLVNAELQSTEWIKALQAGNTSALDPAEHVIPLKVAGITDEEVTAIDQWITSHIGQDTYYLNKQNELRTAMGKSTLGGADTFYIPPPPLESRKFAAIVIDSNGEKGMLFGKTAEELSAAINRARKDFPGVTILQREDTDAWFKAAGEYNAQAAYGATRLDNAMLRKGTMRPDQLTNSFQVLDEINKWYARKEYAIAADATELYYGQQFAEAALAAKALNPAGDANAFTKVINTVLGLTDQNTAWAKINQWLSGVGDKVMEETWGKIQAARKGKITWDEANKIASAYGVNAFENEALWEAAGMKSWTGSAQATVKQLNTLQRVAILGLDYWNAVVNAFGTPILLLPEMRAAMAAGKSVPYFKLIGNAIQNYFTNPALLDRYDKLGIVDKSLSAHRELVDAVSMLSGAKTAQQALQQAGIANGKIAAFIDKMSTPSNWSERFTRYLGADVGRQIAEMRGLTGADVDAFAANFANKVSGNFTAGQRPQVFQGILGSAVGLFQSYQFNYMQQAFRHLEEGNAKNLAMMQALQGTIFGAQSLPGFSIANYHLLEKHNKEHSDIYSNLRELVGEDVGNYVLYGLGSNLLGANLWSRGDSNPRNITVLPVTPSDLAVVSYFEKGIGALKDFAQSVLNGGSLKVSALEAVAHAGVNRPLAGVAEWALGARTSEGGKLDIPIDQDLLSISTAIRFLGAKPMDEAIKMETFQRFNKLKAADQEKLNEIGSALRSQFLSQETGGEDVAVDDFFKRYSDAGGNPAAFRQFYLNQMRAATTPRALVFANATRNSPWARNYQELLQPDSFPALGSPTPPTSE